MNAELLVFEIAGSKFSVPLEIVEEVVPSSAITAVPNSPPFLLGLAAVRGKILAVIDGARRYGIGPSLNSHFMICKVRGNLTAITIDRPVIAGTLGIRELIDDEKNQLLQQSRLPSKFVKSGFELLEVVEDGKAVLPSGIRFLEVDADLFVSAEMASKIGEA